MLKSKMTHKLFGIMIVFCWILPTNVYADLTKEQSEDVAEFAISLIEKGNARRDENGYPLMVYALSNSAKTCQEIRLSGYEEKLYYIKNNNYHKRNGKYIELGYKWCMDCGDYISYVYKTTLGLDMLLEKEQDPWHIKDIYADARKGENSQYFEFVYHNVPISSLREENLQKGDIILRLGSRENHGLIYVGENMQTAHASRNGIYYGKNPVILGFEIVTLNKFYKSSTIVSVARVKDGVIPTSQEVNGIITWPDTGEKEDLLMAQKERKEIKKAIQLASFTLPFIKGETDSDSEVEEMRVKYLSVSVENIGKQRIQENIGNLRRKNRSFQSLHQLFWYNRETIISHYMNLMEGEF